MRITFALNTVIAIAAYMLLGVACESASEKHPFAIAWNYDTSGYLETCGCSSHQLGGIAKRATILSELRQKQDVLAIEGAHFIETNGEFQLFKGETVIRTLNAMDYNAVVLGVREAQHGMDAVQQLADLAEMPALCANLTINSQPWKERTAIVTIGGVRVGITAVSQPEFANFVLPEGVRFTDPCNALDAELPELSRNSDFIVVCLEGETTWVHQLAKDYQHRVQLFLSGIRQEPSANLLWETAPPILNNYLYGKYIGFITVDPLPNGFQLAGMTINLNDDIPDDTAIIQILDTDYKAQLRERFFSTIKVDLTQLYLPPDSCEPCHKEAYATYSESGHSKAITTLHEADQLYNPDCMRCHVVYDPQRDELQAMNCVMCHVNITEQHIWDAVKNEVQLPPEPVTAYTFEWCSRCHDDLNSLRFKDAWPQMVNRIYHGGDNRAALMAAEEMEIDYFSPPPPK